MELPIERAVDLRGLTWPSRKIATGEDGEGINRAYLDLRGCTWTQVRLALNIEERILSRGDSGEEQEAEEEHEQLFWLDTGVASSVLALAAARCVPLTSCNGSPGHAEAHPLVVFRSRPARVPDLLASAQDAGCGLVVVDDGKLLVYSDDVGRMMAFAGALLARRRKLAPLVMRRLRQDQQPRLLLD